MKKMFRKLIAGLTVAVLVGCGSAALAAEEAAPAIGVQLDGQPLVFTDAVPQVKNQRTFLPFRAVFESMGAEVSYEGNTITAKRDARTLTMTIGSTDAVVTENGVSTPIVMDVAPYVGNATWRTYVPVRFAAQAFGCAVGWDQDDQTAIIVDVEKLLADAKSGRTFDYLKKYLTYAEKYQTGIWDMNLTLDGDMQMMGGTIGIGGSAMGTVEDSTKMNMDMTMTMDMTDFMAALYEQAAAAGQPMEPMTAEDQAMLDALATEGINMNMRADMARGLMYMTMNGSVLESAGLPKDTWFSTDLNALLAQSGMDFGTLMEIGKSMDYEALIKLLLQEVPLTDAATDYAELKLMAEKVADLMCDTSFRKSGSDMANTIAYAGSGVELKITLTLNMKNDRVAGYSMDCFVSAPMDETNTVTIQAKESMDANDRMNADVAMELGQSMSFRLNMNGGYTRGTVSPVTEPPAGASVIPFESLLGA